MPRFNVNTLGPNFNQVKFASKTLPLNSAIFKN